MKCLRVDGECLARATRCKLWGLSTDHTLSDLTTKYPSYRNAEHGKSRYVLHGGTYDMRNTWEITRRASFFGSDQLTPDSLTQGTSVRSMAVSISLARKEDSRQMVGVKSAMKPSFITVLECHTVKTSQPRCAQYLPTLSRSLRSVLSIALALQLLRNALVCWLGALGDRL